MDVFGDNVNGAADGPLNRAPVDEDRIKSESASEERGLSREGSDVGDGRTTEDQIASGPTASEDVGDEGQSADQELDELRDRLLRQAAEFQNFRRRVEQERKRDVKFGQSLVLQEMLDVYDDLRRSLESAEEEIEKATGADGGLPQGLFEGVQLVYRKFTDVLQRFGVEPIQAIGAAFDEHQHEAMMQQPAPEGTEPGTVLGEIQKGYKMGDRVLRHSKVVVSS